MKKILKSLIEGYTTVFIIVDALDECRDYDFNDELRALRQTASLMIFSRRISRIEREFQDCLQLEVNVQSAEEIKSYVAHRSDDPKFSLRHLIQEDQLLADEIVSTTVANANGM